MSILPGKRAWIHLPVGLLNVVLLWANPPLGILFGVSFLAYEVTQGSKAHLDIVGWTWGLGAGGIVWAMCEWLA